MSIMKKGTISFIKVEGCRRTAFNSALEKQRFIDTHSDAKIFNYWATEPLYMLIDTAGFGFCLTPKSPVTYNEALALIDMYS